MTESKSSTTKVISSKNGPIFPSLEMSGYTKILCIVSNKATTEELAYGL